MIFDTDFLIAYARGSRALTKTRARAFFASLESKEPLLISRVSWMEFVAGYAEEAAAVAELPLVTMVEFDGELWWGASRIIRELGLRRLTIGTPDCMIAATALAYGQTLVTLNHSHFERVVGLKVITPH